VTTQAAAVQPEWRVLVPAGVALGERPVWDQGSGSLFWVDILAGDVHRSRDTGSAGGTWADSTIHVGDVVGAVALRDDGGLVAGVDSSIRFLDTSGVDDAVPVDVAMPVGHRFNDGACDPAGRFLIGSGGSTPTGLLWSLDSTSTVRVALEGLTESNGLGWSDDGLTMFLIDSAEPVIRRYEYDPFLGRIGQRVADLVDLSNRSGCPDGLVVDALNRLWVPQWEGGQINCIDQEGNLLLTWTVPTTQPTCAGFAGERMDILVLATSWECMTSEGRASEPWAGHLLAAATPVPGGASHRFTRTH
jgi:sugar lactone lactonase YvrE